MGNGVSNDRGSLPSYGKRGVRRATDRRQHDWSELATAPITKQPNSLLTTANSYIGASNVGPSSPKENRKSSSVMKDDRSRRKKTGSVMQVEPDTGQIAYTSASTASPPPETAPSPGRLKPETALPPGQLKRTALPSLQLKTTSRPDEDSTRPAGPAVDSARPAGQPVARQQEEEMAVEKELSAPQLAGIVDRFLPKQQVHDFRPKPETEIQRAEKRLCDQYNDAYDAYHYRPSFYSPPGYAQCVYPNGVQYTPFPEIQHFSRRIA